MPGSSPGISLPPDFSSMSDFAILDLLILKKALHKKKLLVISCDNDSIPRCQELCSLLEKGQPGPTAGIHPTSCMSQGESVNLAWCEVH